MNMNIPVSVRLGMGGVQHIAFIEMLCALGAVFQHRAHGGVAVDICVFALDIAVGCILVGDVLEGFHQSVVHVSDSGTFCTIEDIRLCGAYMPVVNQYALYGILNLLYRRGVNLFFFKNIGNLLCKCKADSVILFADGCCKGFFDGTGDFVDIKMHSAPVSFGDGCNHNHSLFPIFPVFSISIQMNFYLK